MTSIRNTFAALALGAATLAGSAAYAQTAPQPAAAPPPRPRRHGPTPNVPDRAPGLRHADQRRLPQYHRDRTGTWPLRREGRQPAGPAREAARGRAERRRAAQPPEGLRRRFPGAGGAGAAPPRAVPGAPLTVRARPALRAAVFDGSHHENPYRPGRFPDRPHARLGLRRIRPASRARRRLALGSATTGPVPDGHLVHRADGADHAAGVAPGLAGATAGRHGPGLPAA